MKQFSPECDKLKKEWCFLKCRDIVNLFPYHLDEIMSVAQEFDGNISDYRKNLEEVRDKTLNLFKFVYESHLDFVRKNDISLKKPIAFERLGLDRIEQLKKVIHIKLLKENEKKCFQGCLGERPDEALICFNEKAFLKILDAFYKLISDILEFNLAQHENPISSNAQLLSVRTLEIGPDYIGYNDFIKTTSNLLGMFNIKNSIKKTGFSDLLLDIILKELGRGNEIAYYNRSFGPGSWARKLVFC